MKQAFQGVPADSSYNKGGLLYDGEKLEEKQVYNHNDGRTLNHSFNYL